MAPDREPRMTRVKEVITDTMHYCYEDKDLAQAAHLMSERQSHRLPILSRSKQWVGIVSLRDLATKGEAAAVSEAISTKCSYNVRV